MVFFVSQGLLKHDPINDLLRQAGPHPGPLDEVQLWATRLKKLHSVNEQLDSPVAADILRNLDEACSTYASSFSQVRKDIYKVSVCIFLNIYPLVTDWMSSRLIDLFLNNLSNSRTVEYIVGSLPTFKLTVLIDGWKGNPAPRLHPFSFNLYIQG